MDDCISERPREVTQPRLHCLLCKGQALVEFTLVFLLVLVVAWIPADFGLAFYSLHPGRISMLFIE